MDVMMCRLYSQQCRRLKYEDHFHLCVQSQPRQPSKNLSPKLKYVHQSSKYFLPLSPECNAIVPYWILLSKF
jgi:hypothetical protein